MMHGMNVDFGSKLNPSLFLPSKVDLVRVRRSFISEMYFGVQNEGIYHRINIIQSSVGYGVHLAANSLEILGTVVPPFTRVTRSAVNDKDDNISSSSSLKIGQLMKLEIPLTFGYVLYVGLIFGTMLPSYEVWVNVFGDPDSIWIAVPALACSLTLHTISMTVIFAIFQAVALAFSKSSSKPWSATLHQLLLTFSYNYQTYSVLSVILGSPVYNCLLRMLGVKIDGRALLFPSRIHEFSMINFSDKAIIDSDHISGHYAVYDDITIGACRVGGISCGRNYFANALSIHAENGPMRAFVGTYPSSGKENRHNMSSTYRNNVNDHEEQMHQENVEVHV